MNQPLLVLAFALPLAASGTEFKLDGQTLTLPDGFTIEKVAGPGLVDRPIVADFDERGHLYVADSSGSNEPVAKQLEQKPHRIVRLTDTNGDGIFDQSNVFADKMMFPEGVMWFNGSLYVSAPPVIWKLTDADDDGEAEKREEWLDAKTLTGCANDLHGPYLGLDGWIYWCKGAFAQQTYDRPDGKPFVTRASHIFRRRPEGGWVEPVMTGGMDNPVEVVFTPEGERILTTTFFRHPGGGQRDGLIHAIYGGVYGKDHDVLDSHKRTGGLMPVLTHLGPAAPCGLARYESDVFGPEYRDNLFACLFNLHKVTRHQLRPEGASFRTEDSDFLVSDSTDFHPTDVLEDADGSLLVINTGGWYKLCCPTSQLWKPDILGAIYRVRAANAKRIPDPRGRAESWSEANLPHLLGDSRPAVVREAVRRLRATPSATPELKKILRGSGPPAVKRNAIWALTGRRDKDAVAILRAALKDADPSVRQSAVHSLGVSVEKSALRDLLPLLEAPEPPVRRAAAEAVGRMGDPSAVAPLLRAAGGVETADRALEHSLIYALIEINAPEPTAAGLADANPRVKRAALIALDQMDARALQAETVLPLLRSNEPLLKSAADWIVSRRGDWGGKLAAFFAERLKSGDLDEDFRRQLAALASSVPIQELLAAGALDDSLSNERRVFALEAMREARLKETPPAWVNALASLPGSGRQRLTVAAVDAAASFSFKEVPRNLKEALLGAASNSALPAEARLQALGVIAAGLELSAELFEFTRECLSPDRSIALRGGAAGVLARAKLKDDQLAALGETVKQAGPLELGRLLGAYEHSTSEFVGRTLLSSLRESRGISGVPADRVRQLFAKYPASLQPEARELCLSLDADAARQAARIDELLPKLKSGDVRRGQAIFNSSRAACSSCHQFGYLGGNLGPDLTRIGQVRTERDLLEAVVYPSLSFVRSYEPVIVETRSGEQYSGVLRKDAPDELILGTGPGVEVRIARADVLESRPGKVSVMPQGLDEQLTESELADLLAFLKAAR